jgi:hypothetical protein
MTVAVLQEQAAVMLRSGAITQQEHAELVGEPDHSVATAAIAKFNAVISEHPLTMFWTFLGSRMVSWYAIQQTLSATGILCGSELAVGFLLARITSKFRQPLNVLIAAGIMKAAPIMSTVHVSPLLTGMAGDQLQTEVSRSIADTDWSQSKKERALSRLATFDRGMKWVQGPIDKYGASFYIASKITTLALIVGSAQAIASGFDVTAQLAEWGVSDSIQDGFGSMAGAVLLNSVLLPAHVVVAVDGSVRIGKAVDDMDRREEADVGAMATQFWAHPPVR